MQLNNFNLMISNSEFNDTFGTQGSIIIFKNANNNILNNITLVNILISLTKQFYLEIIPFKDMS